MELETRAFARAFALIREHGAHQYIDDNSIRSSREETLALVNRDKDKAITIAVVEITVVRELESV